jgi:hypothetical protein
MEQSFIISVEMPLNSNITEFKVVSKNRFFEVYHHDLLFCTLRKIKGDLWYQIDGDLKQEIVEVIGNEIDSCLEYA